MSIFHPNPPIRASMLLWALCRRILVCFASLEPKIKKAQNTAAHWLHYILAPILFIGLLYLRECGGVSAYNICRILQDYLWIYKFLFY